MSKRIDEEWNERIHERVRGVPDVFPDPRGLERLEIFERYLNSPGRKPILITGPSGTGKTELVRHGLNTFGPPLTDVAFIETFDRADPFAPIEQTIDRIRRSRNKRHIVVLDEADRLPPRTIDPILRRLYNRKAVSKIILISVAPMKIESAQVINLGPPEGKLYGLRDQLIVPSQSIISVVKPQIVTINNTLIKRLKKAPSDVFSISPRQFEELIAELLAGMGMDVELTPETRDGGKDILAYAKTELGQILTLVEAKQFNKTRPVGVSLVRSLFGTVVDHGASTGMLVTTSRFAKPAEQFQERHRYQLSLKDYEDVVSWIVRHKESG